MAYHVIITTKLDGNRRIQYKSTGHNGDHVKRMGKRKDALRKAYKKHGISGTL